MDSDLPPSAQSPHAEHHATDMTTGSVARRLVFFAVPMLLGSLLQTAYSIVNALWVGNGLGAEAMAAITVSFPLLFLLMALAGGLGLATNVLAAQAFGAKDFVQLKSVIQNSVVLTGVSGVLCVAIGQACSDWVFRKMGTPPEVLPMAIGYFRIFLWTTPFMFGVFYQASVMRGVGDSKTPLYFQAASLAVNAVLDPVLMFGWFGLPRLGLNGVAWASIVAQILAFASIAVYAHYRSRLTAPDWRALRLELPMALLLLRLGIPSMIQQAMVSLGMLFVTGIVNGFGAHCAAAFGIAMRIDQLAFMPAMAVGAAVSTLAGQNIGAHRYDRVREVFRWGIVVSCALTVAGTVAAIAVPVQLVSLFSRDADVVLAGARYLRIVGFGYLLFAILCVSHGVINGSGHTGMTSLFSLIGFWVVRVPLATFLARHLGSVEGVWYAVLVSIAVGSLVSLAYYLSGRWKRPVVKPRAVSALRSTAGSEE